MWYYAFLFLTTIIAVVCSITASIKLMHEQHNILNRFSTIANDQEATAGTDASIQICMTNNSGVFRKVVGRCILYPLGTYVNPACIINYVSQHICSLNLCIFSSVYL